MNRVRNIVYTDLRRLEGVRLLMAFYAVLLAILSVFDQWGQGICLVFYVFFYLWCATCTNVSTEYFYACLPVSRREVVLAKYINAIIGIALPSVLFIVLRVIAGNPVWGILKTMISLSLLFAAVALPLLLHFEALKARYSVTALYVLGIAAFSIIGALTGWSFETQPQITGIIVLVPLGAFVLSYLVSIRLYERREFLL